MAARQGQQLVMISNPVGFLFNAHKQWQQVARLTSDSLPSKLVYPILLALGPPIAWFYGSTKIGWVIGSGDVVKLTEASAMPLVISLYLAMLVSLCIIGYFIHWMAETYGSESSIVKGIVLASYAATPLFLAGLAGFYPLFWLDLLLAIAALGWSVYLLYSGIPVVMGIPEERGFLYASAVVGICMVIFMCLMGTTVVLWDLGMAPVFTD